MKKVAWLNSESGKETVKPIRKWEKKKSSSEIAKVMVKITAEKFNEKECRTESGKVKG